MVAISSVVIVGLIGAAVVAVAFAGGLVALATGALGLWLLAARSQAETVRAESERPEIPDATGEALSA